MWQTMYDLHRLRQREIEAAVERRRLWAHDIPAERASSRDRAPSRLRAGGARAAAGVSRATARFALWLDCRVALEPREDRALRDA